MLFASDGFKGRQCRLILLLSEKMLVVSGQFYSRFHCYYKSNNNVYSLNCRTLRIMKYIEIEIRLNYHLGQFHSLKIGIKQEKILTDFFVLDLNLINQRLTTVYNNMIITIILFVVDYIVLEINDIPLLTLHTLYLIFLTFILWKTKQPKSYSYTLEQFKKIYQTKNLPIPQKIRQCQICRKVKPQRYCHCRHCNRCVYRLDHHCHFVGNCIGQFNTKVYIHLLLNLFLHSLAIVVISALHYQSLLDFKSRRALFSLILLPTLFTLYEAQRLIRAFWLTINRNQTLIQSYKRVRGQKVSAQALLQSYFGKKSIKWLVPTFQKDQYCDIFQKAFPIKQDLEIKQYVYADQYLYGPDEQDEIFEQKQE